MNVEDQVSFYYTAGVDGWEWNRRMSGIAARCLAEVLMRLIAQDTNSFRGWFSSIPRFTQLGVFLVNEG